MTTAGGTGVADDPRSWDDDVLVARVRREDRRAFAELYDRFAPRLVRLARAWGVPDGEREPLAAEVLGDVAMALARHATPAPRSLAAYLATALRRRVGAQARARGRRARLAGTGDAADSFAPPSRDPEVTGDVGRLLCSEHARRAADPEWSPAPLAPAIARLAEHLASGLSDDDRRLLVWLAHDVPLRTAAEWLGVRYDTAGKRAQRLRARLRVRAERWAERLPEEERRAVDAFLRRATSAPAAAPVPRPERAAAGASQPPCQEIER